MNADRKRKTKFIEVEDDFNDDEDEKEDKELVLFNEDGDMEEDQDVFDLAEF